MVAAVRQQALLSHAFETLWIREWFSLYEPTTLLRACALQQFKVSTAALSSVELVSPVTLSKTLICRSVCMCCADSLKH
jgi:hypothetical protein